MPETEKSVLLNALNIDIQSLIPRTEAEFRKECQSVEIAQTLHRHHQSRLLLNFRKIKEYMKKTQRRQGHGNPLFISKEASRLLK